MTLSNHLSPRVQQTQAYLLEGMSEKQVARAMQISIHTVHDYVKVLYHFHSVNSRSELLVKLLRQPVEQPSACAFATVSGDGHQF